MQVQMYARDKGGSYLRLYLLVGLEESGSWQLFKNPYNSLALLKFGNRFPLKHNCHAKRSFKVITQKDYEFGFVSHFKMTGATWCLNEHLVE